MKKIIGIIFLILLSLSVYLLVKKNSREYFSIIVIPDTQKYSEKYPYIFCRQTEWIKQNIENHRIVFVSHLGDIVENGAKIPKEWATASKCMGKLDGVVPYGIIPGNHDTDIVNIKSSGFKEFNKNFPVERFASSTFYKGSFDENQNNYHIVENLGMKLLFLNLEIEPSNEALDWANRILNENKDAFAILSTHKYLPDVLSERDRNLDFSKDGNTGEDIWNKVVKNQCSLRLVLNGHYHKDDGENRIVDLNSCGKKVFQIVQDYQDRKTGGGGKLRIYKFFPKDKEIEVVTYSPYTDTYERDEDSKFELKWE